MLLIKCALFVGGSLWLLNIVWQSSPLKKMGAIGQLINGLVCGIAGGWLNVTFDLFPGEYGFWIFIALLLLSGGIFDYWIDREEANKRQEKLNWLLHTDNEKVVAVRDEILARAFSKSYESMGQREADIAQFGALLEDHGLATQFIEDMEKRGSQVG